MKANDRRREGGVGRKLLVIIGLKLPERDCLVEVLSPVVEFTARNTNHSSHCNCISCDICEIEMSWSIGLEKRTHLEKQDPNQLKTTRTTLIRALGEIKKNGA